MGLTITIGSLNKFTVIIIAIAVGIDLLINRKFKEFTKILVSVVSIMMIFNVTFNLYMYSSHLDRQTANGENTPYNHWVMMGLKGDGVYNPEDYEFTRKYDYDENRNSKINKEIFDLELSSQMQRYIKINFKRRFPVQAFAWTLI